MSSLSGVAALSILIGIVILAMGTKSRGGFAHGGTKIWGEAWFIFMILGIVLLAIDNGLPR